MSANIGILDDDDYMELVEDIFRNALPEDREALACSLVEIGFPPHIGFNAEGIPMFDEKQVFELSQKRQHETR